MQTEIQGFRFRVSGFAVQAQQVSVYVCVYIIYIYIIHMCVYIYIYIRHLSIYIYILYVY